MESHSRSLGRMLDRRRELFEKNTKHCFSWILRATHRTLIEWGGEGKGIWAMGKCSVTDIVKTYVFGAKQITNT